MTYKKIKTVKHKHKKQEIMQPLRVNLIKFIVKLINLTVIQKEVSKLLLRDKLKL
jgi:hypothetical protein